MTGIERLRAVAGAWDEWGLGGALAEMADQIERERACDADTIENLRLELGEARDEAAWVREHGGLETVEARLMPEGMEWLVEAWPRLEDGKPVRFLDDFERYGNESCVSVVTMYADGSFALNFRAYSRGERVNRPAPSVPAADGEPLEVGQTVWDTNGDELVIGAIEDGGHTVACRYADVGDGIPVHGMWSPSDLTHQRPVLDADGVPIKKGDTVWDATTSAGPFTVREIERSDDPDELEDIVWCGEHAANGFKVWRIADQLTHTKPERDSWERIEEDAGCTATKYNERRGTIFTTKQQVARDLVRRCRALAERERGE